MFSHLKPMDESDLDWVCAIEKANALTPWSRDGFVRALRQGMNYVFCNSSEMPLGFCCLLPVVDELHLLNISVDADYQGRKVGKQGLQAVFQRFESTEYRVMLLEVRRSNKVARNLYRGLGFEQDGVRKGYYSTPNGDREDAILMSKSLI